MLLVVRHNYTLLPCTEPPLLPNTFSQVCLHDTTTDSTLEHTPDMFLSLWKCVYICRIAEPRVVQLFVLVSCVLLH